MAAQGQYKIDIGHYDGTGGSLRARSFIGDVDNALAASAVADARMAGIVRSALRGDARLWLDTQVSLGTAGLGLWSTLKPLLLLEFAARLTVAELAALERSLEHKGGERVAAFYVRCQRFHLEEDSDLPAATLASVIYTEQFARRVKFSFMKGLRAEVRLAMAGVDVQASSGPELLAAAKTAEILTMKKSEVAPQSKPTEVDAISAGLSTEGQAILAALERRFGRGGPPRGGRGRGQPRGAQRGRGNAPTGENRRPGPSFQELQARDRALCGRCHKMVKHRTAECFNSVSDNTAASSGRQDPRGPPTRSSGGRSYAAAASATFEPGEEFQVYDYGGQQAGNA